MKRPDNFELSIIEIRGFTDWPDTMVEDYRAIGEGLQLLSSQINTIGNVTEAPATATSLGIKGQMVIVPGFIYTCVATNTWERVATATWT